MGKKIDIIKYEDSLKDRWDSFILEKSCNGTLLQTRRFLEYHEEKRFKDASLLFLKGNEIVAVVPGNEVENYERGKQFISHQGSTFGGIVIGEQCHKITFVESIMEELETFILEKKYNEIILKQTSQIFQNKNSEMIDYYLFANGYSCAQEIGFFIDFTRFPSDILSAYSSSRRRDYRYSLRNEFVFRRLGNEEIEDFYSVLCDNYVKFRKTPIHSLNELIDLKKNRLSDEIDFYGIYLNSELIAGGMIFKFGKKVFHTQYLAVKQNHSDIFASEFLYTNLIQCARNEGFEKLSFGTCTFNSGKVLNRSLALFKEGFGTESYINRTYSKQYHR